MSVTTEIFENLINLCDDARRFYEEASALSKDRYTANLLSHLAQTRHSVIVHLSHYLYATGRGEEVREKSGNLYAAPPEISLQNPPPVDLSLVDKIAETEDKTMEQFYHAIGLGIPPAAKAVLSQQIDTLTEARRYVRTMKEQLFITERRKNR